MAISLRAKNENLTAGQKYSYLVTNYSSGVSDIIVTNSDGFVADQYILLGSFGNETSEIVQIDSVTAATHTLTLKVATVFAHPESTRVTIIPYNQIKFFQTATAVFSSTENYLGVVDVQADSLYTIYQDSVNSTGYGWFKFTNSTNLKTTSESNAIPYLGFSISRVKTVLDSFYSLLNSKERALITDKDAFNYMSEGLSIIVSELNLVNNEYNVSGETDVDVISGTSEYNIVSDIGVSDFEKILSLYNGDDQEKIEFIPLSEAPSWGSTSSNSMKYYLRGGVIGFSPEPDTSVTLKMRYKKKSSAITSYYDDIDLPSNMHYMLVDFLMFKSAIKLGSGKEASFLKLFQNNIQRMKVTSHKRSNSIDSWNISDEANV